jgi:hypothetical protein
MTKTIVVLACVLSVGGAFAEEKAAAPPAMPAPPKPGPEHEKLKPFAKSMTWTGKMPAGAMGPGTPEIATKGKSSCKWVANNMWAACDLEDTSGKGKDAITWKAHWMLGYDLAAKEYRAMMADMMGTATTYKGTVDGDKLVLESIGEVDMMGKPGKVRITMDNSDKKTVKFQSEHQFKGEGWVVDGTSEMKPAGK